MNQISKHKVFAAPGKRNYEAFERHGFGSHRSLQTVEICIADNKLDALSFFALAGVKLPSSTAIRRTTNRSYIEAISKHPTGTVMWSPSSGELPFVLDEKG